LTHYLFVGKIGHIVGEEDSSTINILTKPYFVDDLTVPDIFEDVIDDVRRRVEELGNRIHPEAYRELTVFIDPIDGTREFATGMVK
jgi:3'-phosphoadenosine 5'-phosphosulfate (PAPS) 3'-phosphatase